jgi:hypothetical protein
VSHCKIFRHDWRGDRSRRLDVWRPRASNARLLGATGTEVSHQPIIFPKPSADWTPGSAERAKTWEGVRGCRSSVRRTCYGLKPLAVGSAVFRSMRRSTRSIAVTSRRKPKSCQRTAPNAVASIAFRATSIQANRIGPMLSGIWSKARGYWLGEQPLGWASGETRCDVGEMFRDEPQQTKQDLASPLLAALAGRVWVSPCAWPSPMPARSV